MMRRVRSSFISRSDSICSSRASNTLPHCASTSLRSGLRNGCGARCTALPLAAFNQLHGTAFEDASAKSDFADGYKCMPINPRDKWCMAVKIKNPHTQAIEISFANVANFGVVGSGATFGRLATVPVWILNVLGLPSEVFVDDIGHLGTRLLIAVGIRALSILSSILFFQLKMSKHIPCSRCLIYTGIEFDYVEQTCRIPAPYLAKTAAYIVASGWIALRAPARRKDLEHLLGVLQRICICVTNGRINLFYLLRSLRSVRHPHQVVVFDEHTLEELAWWLALLQRPTPLSRPWPLHSSALPTLVSGRTDACWESYGGVWEEDGHFFYFFGLFDTLASIAWSVAAKETWAVACLVLLRGHAVLGPTMGLESDSKVTCDTWNRGKAGRSESNARCLRAVDEAATRCGKLVFLTHLSGETNILADPISRGKFNLFFARIKYAPSSRVHIPQEWTQKWMRG